MANCNSCDFMKKENAQLRKTMLDTNKQYVDVCNRVLKLEKFIRDSGMDVPYDENPQG